VIIVTGGELLHGLYPDSHTCFITRTLRPLGCHCVASLTVDDERAAILQALRFATQKASLVIVTGGLGPTPNDITRETLAEFTGITMREQPDAVAELERRFNQPKDQLRANLRRQALVPTRGTYLKNPNGTAVGLVFEGNDSVVVALPGPPRELQPMVKNELAPYLQQRFGVHPPGASLLLRFVGVGQSLISQRLQERVQLPSGVVVGSVFESGRVDFTFALPGDTPEDHARLKRLAEQVRAQLGDYLYAQDGTSLEEVVVKALLARGGMLVVVEAGSGGHLAAAFNGVEEASRLLSAAYVAPTEERLRQMLKVPDDQWAAWPKGAERANGLAAAAAQLHQGGWVVMVGEAASAPSGSRAAWLVCRFPDGRCQQQQLTLRDTGELGRAGITTPALDQLRRWLR
jgi:nicotinamide-nucleotide amidase